MKTQKRINRKRSCSLCFRTKACGPAPCSIWMHAAKWKGKKENWTPNNRSRAAEVVIGFLGRVLASKSGRPRPMPRTRSGAYAFDVYHHSRLHGQIGLDTRRTVLISSASGRRVGLAESGHRLREFALVSAVAV